MSAGCTMLSMRKLTSYSGEAHGDIELVADGRGVWLGVERCFVGMMSESMARRHDLHFHGGCEDSTPN